MEAASQSIPPLLLTVGLDDTTEEAGGGKDGNGETELALGGQGLNIGHLRNDLHQ